jgi:hypothetical protein
MKLWIWHLPRFNLVFLQIFLTHFIQLYITTISTHDNHNHNDSTEKAEGCTLAALDLDIIGTRARERHSSHIGLPSIGHASALGENLLQPKHSWIPIPRYCTRHFVSYLDIAYT